MTGPIVPFRTSRQDKYVRKPVLHGCGIVRTTDKARIPKCQVRVALLLPSFAGSTGSGRCAHTALGTFCAEPTFRKRLLQVHTWEVELRTDMVSISNPWSNNERNNRSRYLPIGRDSQGCHMRSSRRS